MRSALVVALFVSLAACSKPAPVFLLTIDTLRADHLSSYGYDRQTSPNIDALARDSTVFDSCFAVRGRTTPSYASMMTGLYPYKHGVTSLGIGLAEENLTLAERLTTDGYATSAFVSSTVMIGRLSGLNQGFEVWNDHMPDREANRNNFERTADQTIAGAAVWLGSAPRKSFLFIHLIDPHSPYMPPAPFDTRFQGGSTQPINDRDVHSAARLAGKRTLGQYVSAYDGEIAFADAQLGKLIDGIKAAGLYDDALIIFTADHGESLGEHGSYFRHGTHLHDDTVRVPLMVKPPRGDGRGRERWHGAVSPIDIVPTVLDYLGVEGAGDGIDGTSLRGIVAGRDGDGTRVVFSSTSVGTTTLWAAHRTDGSLIATECPAGEVGGSQGPRRPRGREHSRLACGAAYFDTEKDPAHLSPIRTGDAHDRLESALAGKLAAQRVYKRPFKVERLYNPSDKGFVEEFIRDHNRDFAAPTREDIENLKSLGYL